jgi:Zn finger protein HypA/HybF involved in hydrogenase expression
MKTDRSAEIAHDRALTAATGTVVAFGCPTIRCERCGYDDEEPCDPAESEFGLCSRCGSYDTTITSRGDS